MNTYMNETTLNAINEAIAHFDYQVRLEVCPTIFSKRYDYAYDILIKKLNSIIQDLWICERMGYVTHNEAVGIYGDIQNMRRAAHAKHRQAEEDRLGEREYEIQYNIYHYDMTREMATRAYEEDWD